jgi:hypothetical protein
MRVVMSYGVKQLERPVFAGVFGHHFETGMSSRIE